MATPQSQPGFDPVITAKYASALMEPLKQTWAFAQEGVTNSDYIGEIKDKGDTVKIGTVSRPTIKPYDESQDMVTDDLGFTDLSINIDQGDYFNFRVPLVSDHQAAVPVKDPAIREAAEGMAGTVDTYVAGLMKAGAASSNNLGTLTVDPEKKHAYQTLVKLRAKLNAAGVPKDGRFVMVGDEFESALLYDDRLDKTDNASNLLNGEIGRLLGFRIIQAPTVPKVAGREMVIAGHPIATTFGYQITQVAEVSELPKRWANVVTGLQIYGGKVIRPKALAVADITAPTVEPGGGA